MEHRSLAPFSLLVFLLLLLLFPLLFGELMINALAKLRLSPQAATGLTFAIIFGSFINIPLKRIVRDELVPAHPLAVFGLNRFLPQLQRASRETIIAANLGGCVVPTLIALYELAHLGADTLPAAAVAVGLNTYACFRVARPVAGVGIVMPSLVSPLVAAIVALLLAPGEAPPVAFIAGVAGPLIGADLLHLREVSRSAIGVASIGGAGTFDGIVLSGIIAAYLA